MPSVPAPPPSAEELLLRAKVAGRGTGPGRSETRHRIEHMGMPASDAWAALGAVFGADLDPPAIDPARTVRGAHAAAHRIAAVARSGARIAFATAQPASLLGVHSAVARCARAAGGAIDDENDAGPFRVDGRTPRWLRWFDGVAVVTDGQALLPATGPDGPDEWMFLVGRPALVVADGAYAAAALAAGIEVVVFASLDQLELAVAVHGRRQGIVVPVHGHRPARAYAELTRVLEAGFSSPSAPIDRAM